MKLLLALTLALFITGCVNKPTHNTTVVDDRPRITFDAQLSTTAKHYSVYIDGIAYGSLDNFLSDENALRIISGRHQISITHNGAVIKTYDVTLGANETRVLKVSHDK
ncbi:hypothetical protein KO528_17260 [Saccharophagus degradans]|uniref:PEGA domain-containing protein n=1 Tax=Saccharophagus degradans TaxID=86304 RepID=A0AAW7X8A7_9GAMM|nr:hypothetical protein [Saccharophagus degradans]MBU2987119.1 hypothetical protein [Saccharophagus degradans]MDO6423820.1 hypothetical protein [Saccharophagus degradans]MDO6607900.1 hypothetical protein [Saccharophagus degradans]WGO98780.1 hypothetical protein QFX18_01730 [Saccharophagus degradans]